MINQPPDPAVLAVVGWWSLVVRRCMFHCRQTADLWIGLGTAGASVWQLMSLPHMGEGWVWCFNWTIGLVIKYVRLFLWFDI